MSIETLATFLGWCTVINIAFLIIVLIAVSLLHDWIGEISGKMFGITDDEAKATIFRVFQQYRFSIALFNLVPYIALKLMS